MELESSVEAFFRDEVDRAFKTEGLSPGVMVEHYIVHLLAGYAAHPIDSQPLALRLASAVEAPPRERRRQLREIGDTSLYVSGFWGDSLEETAIDVDYYIEMGGIAYGELARLAKGWPAGPQDDVFIRWKPGVNDAVAQKALLAKFGKNDLYTQPAQLPTAVDVRKMRLEDVYARIGYVPQRGILFSGNVAENIRYGEPEASDDAVARAVDIAQARDYVENVPGLF